MIGMRHDDVGKELKDGMMELNYSSIKHFSPIFLPPIPLTLNHPPRQLRHIARPEDEQHIPGLKDLLAE